jgi:NodT family efflux transporter outer membrane factor (OMF) lipoprotein
MTNYRARQDSAANQPHNRLATAPACVRYALWALLVMLTAPLLGCTSARDYVANGFKVGPNFARPPAPLSSAWIDVADKRVRQESDNLSKWWNVFGDPVLDRLTCFAYNQNLSVRQAGFRVLAARAQLGIAQGYFFPQTQEAQGGLERETVSRRASSVPQFLSSTSFNQWSLGMSLAWELDFWGRLRRGIESADANLDASVEDYDDILVTLLGDVATNYVNIRTLQQRIAYTKANIKIQRDTLKIAEARFGGGAVGELDVDQAKSNLAQTEAQIPELEIALRQASNVLCILLGIPPEDLVAKLGQAQIPVAPVDVAVGIPADLVRRRPDVRKAERQAAAQCALIGVAEADFYPKFSLTGNFGWSAIQFPNVWRSSAFGGNFGPSFQWELLNYGRILNNVRLQDANFQALVAAYQAAVLNAEGEVENGLVTFLKAQERTKAQAESVEYAEKSVKIVIAQYNNGAVDFTRVTQLEQNLVLQQDTLAQARGEIAVGLIQVYRALGGGWEIRCGPCDPTLPTPQATPTPADPIPPAPVMPGMKNGKAR